VRKLQFALSLLVLAALATVLGCSRSSAEDEAGEGGNGPAEPAGEVRSDPKAGSDAPQGRMTEQGLEFTVQYERGEGYLRFSRQNGLLRVDSEVVFPYHAGDMQRDHGSSFTLSLSVDGTHGRHMIYYPAPLWFPGQTAGVNIHRREANFGGSETPRTLAETPAFVGKGDVAHWDRWRVTLYVDLRRVIVPGNTPNSTADQWLAGITAGSVAARKSFPAGMNEMNPGKTPGHLLTFKLSELTTLAAEDESPLQTLAELEEDEHDAQKAIQAHLSVRDLETAIRTIERARKDQPSALWHTNMMVVLAQMKDQLGLKDLHAIPYLEELVKAYPSQPSSHLSLLKELLAADREKDAHAHFARVIASPLATGRAETAGYLRLQWAEALGSWGFQEKALEQLAQVEEQLLKENDGLRVNHGLTLATLAELRGDSREAADLYARLMVAEREVLTPNQLQEVQRKQQFQLQAHEQWEDELVYRQEDAAKQNPRWIVETSRGRIVMELFEDDAPNTVAALVDLARKEFYDNLTFHRVVPGFVAQGGCPVGDGTGSPGYRLKAEVSRRNHFRGSVAMARSQHPDSQGCQFYICLSNGPSVVNLSGSYVVVGRVLEGIEVADRLRVGEKIKSIRIENLRDHDYKPETLPEQR
jgi:peptidyl-prolyl cis-trans isomerase B (cyclophilin B)